MRRVLVLSFWSTILLACDSLPAPAPANPGGAAGSAPAVTCVAPTGGPTVHDSAITADEVWTAADSPHIVSYLVSVRGGATLHIEPCAEVLLEKEAVLRATGGGTIRAEGTASQPIHFAGKDGARWTKIELNAPGVSRLAYVSIEGGGGADVNDIDQCAVEVRGDDTFPADPVLSVDHVTIRGSRGAGLAIFSKATFAPDAHDLVITGCGGDAFPYPISIEEHSMDSLPTGTYTGNAKDEILLRKVGAGTAGDGLKVDATLHDRGVPYRLGGGFNVAANEDGKLATLTIEPGVTVKVPKGRSFEVEHWSGEKPATGVLRALGTADRPIVFTSAEDAPAAGDWQGFWFGQIPNAQNLLDHVIIEYTGADCGCSLASCNTLEDWDGAILINNYPDGGQSFLNNSIVRHGKGHGVVEGWAYPDGDSRNQTIDFTSTNTFDVSGCATTLPGNTTAGGCPKPKPTCN